MAVAPSSPPLPIAVVVVTFNRPTLLLKCLAAIAAQTRAPDTIVLVDNASTEETPRALDDSGWRGRRDFDYLRLPANIGGSGGFNAGVARALELGVGWIWMMDDDAVPAPDALERLLSACRSTENVYGSLAVNSGDLCWPLAAPSAAPGWPIRADEIPAEMEVQFLPFLGFMIHRDLVERIGLPDPDYFIAADDLEYSLRARLAGAKTIVIASSRIEHPKAELAFIRWMGQRISCLRLVPWKRYYDTRNRLLNARKYYGRRLYTEAVPGTLVRLAWVLWNEPHRVAQFHAFAAAIVDGLSGTKGIRHKYWKISP